jgi:HJR/Mrr/RecB family endonuclease
MKNKNTKNTSTYSLLWAALAIVGAILIALGSGTKGGVAWIIIGIAAIGVSIFMIVGAPMTKREAAESHNYTITSVTNVDRMEGHEFEYFCAELLERCGFEAVTVTRGSGDQGVDILAFKEDIKYAIQCKNYSTPLGNKPIQEVFAGKTFYKCHVGVVMTNSTFTKGAIELADSVGVILWDKTRLDKMMVKTGMQEFVKTK